MAAYVRVDTFRMSAFVLCLSLLIVSFACEANDVCLELQSGKQAILGIGLHMNRFVLITTKSALFDLPRTALDTKEQRLYLHDDVPLKDKWPILDEYMSNKALVALSDDQYDYILSIDQSKSLYAYNIDKYKLLMGSLDNVDFINGAISSPEKLLFYGIHANDTGNSPKYIQVHTYLLNGSMQVDQTRLIQINQQDKYICPQDDGLHIEVSTSLCVTELSFQNSFTDGRQFYLFLDRFVYIFDHSALTSGEQVKMHNIPLDQFLVCDQVNTTTPYDPIMHWLIVTWSVNLFLTLGFIYSLIIYIHWIEPMSKRKICAQPTGQVHSTPATAKCTKNSSSSSLTKPFSKLKMSPNFGIRVAISKNKFTSQQKGTQTKSINR